MTNKSSSSGRFVTLCRGLFANVLCDVIQCICCRLNRKAKYNLEKDLADKFQALAIDGHNAELHLSSQGNKLVKDAGRMTAK